MMKVTINEAIKYLNVEKQKLPTEFNYAKREEVYNLAIFALQELRGRRFGYEVCEETDSS